MNFMNFLRSFSRLLSSFAARLAARPRLALTALFTLSFLLLLVPLRTQEAGDRARGLNPNKPVTQYILDTWQNEPGLQVTAIEALRQTRDGYLWLGTPEGLIRFDGVAFSVLDRSNSGLKSNRITSIAEDAQGTLWVGTDVGLHALQNGKFTLYTTKNGLGSNVITTLFASRKTGILWVGTEGGGLSHAAPATKKSDDTEFSTYTTKDGLTSDAIYSITEDAQGALWVGTEGGGLNFLSGGGNARCTPYVLDNSNLDSYTVGDPLPGAPVTTLMFARDGILWAGTSEGLSRIQPNGGAVKEFTTATGLSNNDIRHILQDREGTIWLATGGGGIQRMLVADAKGMPLAAPLFSTYSSKILLGAGGSSGATGLTSDETAVLLEDREGALWIGCGGGGLNRFKDRRFLTYTAKDGLITNNTYSVAQDSAGALWIGTNGGLSRLQPPTAQTDAAWTNFTLQNGLANSIVYSLLTAKNGTLWVGTRNGLQAFTSTGASGTFRTYTSADGLPDNAITSLAQIDSTIWIATDNGIASFAASSGRFSTFNKQNGLPSENIRALLADRSGTLWMGTRGAGLIAYKDGKFTSYKIQDGLSSNYIWGMYEDSDGTLWIATNGGINRLKGGKFQVLTRKHGLADDAIFSISDDAAGWLWMGSSKGIFRVKKTQIDQLLSGGRKVVDCLTYSLTDGLRSLESASGTQPNLCKARDGSLYFATTRGVSMVEPLSIPYNPLMPPVIIESILADGERIAGMGALIKSPDADDMPSSGFSADSAQVASLAPGVEKFEFHYTATSLLMPERVKFRYMLQGYDQTWVDAGSRRTAYYTNLPHSKTYSFRVQACNNDGVWNETGATASFYLRPFFYETWWFTALCIVGVLAAVVLFYTLRVRAIQKRNKVLKRMVDEQTSEIRRQADSIQEQNAELESKNTIITANNEKLSELLEKVESSIRYAKRIQDAMLPYHERISRALSEYFILFKPRDIVSGDFYWFVEHGNSIVIAAADCTGHGVPGAFMSMIGNSMLTQIVVEQDITNADEILNNLHVSINRALKQDEGESRDGMDIALCVIDSKTHEVQYAGAMNPLYYVQNGELFEVKADRQPIGGQSKGKERIFTRHHVDLKGQTMFYLFSDGYADQFGGGEGKKFMSKRFKELIMQIHARPMNEQRQILDDTIEAWKGGVHKQIDDILVFGVRLK
jgi:ligand-binding sensor domain-containing protein/serine phosphatase RsbU (regulator of sigma subunit)